MLYSPPSVRRSKIGRFFWHVLRRVFEAGLRANRPDVFRLGAETERRPRQMALEVNQLEARLEVIGVAAEQRQIDAGGDLLALVREDRVVDRVVNEARRPPC